MALNKVLHKSIQAHGDEIANLEYREPASEDAIDIGEMPYVVLANGRVKPLPDVAAQYLVKMAGIPMSSVKQLDLRDFNDLVWEVVNFFWQPAAPVSSN